MSNSSNHKKIVGDFGEALVLYWLSKDEFECAKVDHTGIDLIASNPHTKKRMGISVKSRTRLTGKEKDCVTLKAKDFNHIETACEKFGCQPYFAIVIEAGEMIQVFITPVSRALHYRPRTKAGSSWKMSAHFQKLYKDDKKVMMFELKIKDVRWWTSKS
jgi:hypothetical protein